MGESNAALDQNNNGGASGKALCAEDEENYALFLAFREQMRLDNAPNMEEQEAVSPANP